MTIKFKKWKISKDRHKKKHMWSAPGKLPDQSRSVASNLSKQQRLQRRGSRAHVPYREGYHRAACWSHSPDTNATAAGHTGRFKNLHQLSNSLSILS